MVLLVLLCWKQIKFALSSQEALYKEKVCPFSRIQNEEKINYKTMFPSLEMKTGQKVRQKREMAAKLKTSDQRGRQQKQKRWGVSISKAHEIWPLSQEGKWEAECCVRVSTVVYWDWPAQWLNCTCTFKWHQLSQERGEGEWSRLLGLAGHNQAARNRETLWSSGN